MKRRTHSAVIHATLHNQPTIAHPTSRLHGSRGRRSPAADKTGKFRFPGDEYHAAAKPSGYAGPDPAAKAEPEYEMARPCRHPEQAGLRQRGQIHGAGPRRHTKVLGTARAARPTARRHHILLQTPSVATPTGPTQRHGGAAICYLITFPWSTLLFHSCHCLLALWLL
jgi:hypothetical protein